MVKFLILFYLKRKNGSDKTSIQQSFYIISPDYIIASCTFQKPYF